MVEINLLPWRDEKSRYERRSIYFLCVCGAVLSVLMMLAVHGVIASGMNHQQKRMNHLRTKFSFHKSQKSSLQLENISGPPLVLLFNKIGKTVHAGMCYERVTRDENSMHMVGFAHSMQAVMTAWRQLSRTHELTSLRVKEVKPEASGGYRFTLELPANAGREEW